MPHALKSERFDLRMTNEEKELFETAASLSGLPLTAFVMTNLKPIANEIINRNKIYIDNPKTVLSYRDSIKFIELLEREDDPNPALKAAYAKYRKLKRK